MDQLRYVPNKKDKENILCLLKKQPEQNILSQLTQKQLVNEKKSTSRELSKSQLDVLLKRLTKITKKQYDIQQQTTHILHQNKELQQKRVHGDKVENRLLAKGKEKEKKIADMAEQLQQERKQNIFREVPQITKKGQQVIQNSLDRRLDKLIIERENKKKELFKKYEPPFKPSIDSHSQFINDIQNLGDLHNRMETKQKEALKRKSIFAKKIVEEEKKQLTFQPQINEKSKQIAEKLPLKNIYSSQDQMSSVLASQVYPFAPQINKNTDKLLKNREKDQDCFKRLFNQAKEYSEKNQQKREERVRAMSFQPEINKKSRKLAISRKTKENMTQEAVEQNADSQFFEEVKIGNQIGLQRGRTYSLRGSQITKRPWFEESDQQSFRDLKATIRQRLNQIK